MLYQNIHAEVISVVVSGTPNAKLGDTILSKIGAGGYAGEMSFFSGSPASATVIASKATSIINIARNAF